MPTLINLPRRWSSRASQSLLGELSSQVGGFSEMGAAQVTGNLLILITVQILDAVSYLGLSCSWAQTLSPRLPPRLRS